MSSNPPIIEDRQQSWRTHCITAVMLLLWSILAWRLIDLQAVRHEEFVAKAQRQQTRTETIPARPGDIVDRSGRLLATTTARQSLFVDPKMVDDIPLLAQQIALALDLDAKKLTLRIEQSREKRFLWIRRRMSDKEFSALLELELPRHCIGFRPEFQRHYPQGKLAAHILGLRSIDGDGRGGVEQQYDTRLRGIDGSQMLRKDARGFVLDVVEASSTPPRNGENVVLTIDAVIQHRTEAHLDALMAESQPVGACAVVLDPQSGEVLAMASRPAFNPNDPASAPSAGWKNLALDAVFEPGSTFKPCIVAWALDKDVLKADETLDCERGAYRMGRRVLHDHHSYAGLSVEDVLVKSSNIGMAKIGERLGNEGLFAACTTFGFGRPTGIDLPGELPGLLHPLNQWTSYSTGSIPMGQELAATPLQIITAHAALANGGTLITPHITRECIAASANSTQATRGADSISTRTSAIPWSGNILRLPVASSETSQWIVQGPMVNVVSRGTGKVAKLDDYTVFGKTGTAQKHDPETGGYSHRHHVCSFICGAPAHDPRVLVLVTVDDPSGPGAHYGGTVAAPTAREILHDALIYLRVPTGVSPPYMDNRERLATSPEADTPTH